MQVKKLLDEKHKILETFNPSLLKQLKLVSKISLQVGLIAVISLTLMLFILLPKLPEHYTAFTQLILQVQNNLYIMLGLSGLLLLIGASITIWFICLYASFRISGPLYCFSKDLKLLNKSHPHTQIKLRENDSLQAECQLYNQSMENWQQFYQEINTNNQLILQYLQQHSLSSPNTLQNYSSHLNNLINKIKN